MTRGLGLRNLLVGQTHGAAPVEAHDDTIAISAASEAARATDLTPARGLHRGLTAASTLARRLGLRPTGVVVVLIAVRSPRDDLLAHPDLRVDDQRELGGRTVVYVFGVHV